MKNFGIPVFALALAAVVGLGVAVPSTAQAQSGWFDRVDRNNDGFISKRERYLAHQRWQARKYWNGNPRRHAYRYGNQPWPKQWKGGKRFYKWADRNNDGYIGKRERRQARRAFNWADRNNDGRLSRWERNRVRNFYNRADRNNDGRLNRWERNRARNGFNWADRNNDGRIGPRERNRAREAFNRADRNNDGRIGPRERRRDRDGRRN